MTTLFLSGIDTDIGKSVACGALASSLLDSGFQLSTQKWVETGTLSGSQDLLTHQKIAKKKFNTSASELHLPYRFDYPASPHLSARLENHQINPDYLVEQTRQLEADSEHVIIEGSGGLCVPLNHTTMMIDLVAQLNLPILLVTSARLGSINHTILSLEACQQRDIEVRAVIYNHFPRQEEIIFCETRDYLKNYLDKKQTIWLELSTHADQIDLSDSQIKHLLR
ncbi:dethiobiotin synthase [Arenicella sp.]|nr:dethiobiotin synthase [Arenicella sp.]